MNLQALTVWESVNINIKGHAYTFSNFIFLNPPYLLCTENEKEEEKGIEI